MQRALTLLPILLVLGADAADDAKKELEKFQGKWTPTKYVKDGKALGEKAMAQIELTVEGNKSTFKKGANVTHGTYKVNAAKSPKELDITPTDGSEADKTLKAIYKFEGDDLVICIAPAGKDRPKDFASKEDSQQILEVWKRK